ncbi:helix-turn-helix transcriptional regulator [Comamonas composti]|uniref:helix-turn-helix transcriptional regulator n=1 Tax=Comamonas composti TaxID=408558 RepID=UPI000415DD0E|nr:helix-turn-helix transcriptional regulator [Comamonas composti]
MSAIASKNLGFHSACPHLLQVSDLERSLEFLGREYIVGDLAVTSATDLLQGSMKIDCVQPGMVLYRTRVQDLRTMRTSNLLYPGLKIALLLEGETELSYGGLRLHLRAGQAGQCAAVVALTRTDRFMRQWRAGRRERKLILTLTPQWLEQAGVMRETMAEFMTRHLAYSCWQPSARVLALADQLHRGRTLPAHLQMLWTQSRCLEIVLEAIAGVSRAAAAKGLALAPSAAGGEEISPALAPVRNVAAQPYLRLAALRDWLCTSAADGMDMARIARHAGMSLAHLQRHFPAVADGQSLGRFVRAQRLQRARAALEQGQVTVAQAAQLAGYRSSSHFSGAFQAHFGCSPSALKARLGP